MRLAFVSESNQHDTKALVGIEEPWVQSPRVNNKKLPMIGEFFNGDILNINGICLTRKLCLHFTWQSLTRFGHSFFSIRCGRYHFPNSAEKLRLSLKISPQD